ncbi:MAG: hypothetical protein GF417_11980 [Candidatus Latescibacteria bacterium]|nr:hypothetical protein [bacterium]MBD3425145.1 hypothetical protein [Candidatus Latescibacterota bacterium]
MAAYLLMDRRYNSTGVILLSGESVDNIPMMAEGSELGIYLADNYRGGINITLYPAILESRRIGKDILRKEYTFSEEGRKVTRTLIDHLNLESMDAALYILAEMTDFWIDEDSNTLAIRASTDNPELSAAVVNAYVNRLEQFNRLERRSASKEAYAFIEVKLRESRRELRRAEEALKNFRSRNRNYASASDPQLLMKHRRLIRELELNQAIYEELNKQLEKTAINVEKDTPILSVLDRGYVPLSHSSPGLFRLVLSFTLLGLLLGTLCVVTQSAYRSWRGGGERRRIESLLNIFFSELRSLFSLRRIRGRAGRVEN